MKSCWQCVKGQSIVCVVLLLSLFVYLYLPSWFNVLICTSPLAICTAVFLQRLLRFGRQNTRTMKPDGENDKATTQTQSSTRDSGALRKKLRPAVQAAMSRRTFKKKACEELGKIVVEDMKVDFIFGTLPDEMPTKLREAKGAHGSNDPVSLSSEKPEAPASVTAETDACKNDGGSQKDDQAEAEPRHEGEKNKRVMEWTEEDKRNHVDLASSDVEWNKRLENLIASRRARKMFSMLPQRNPIDSVVADDLQGRVTPILTERDHHSDNEGGQPGSAPSVLLPTNPFDIPYDPSEEKPILTGDGFGDEFVTTLPKDLLFCKHESFSYGHPYRSGSSVFSNPLASIGPGAPRFRRQSDARENIKQDLVQLFQEVKHKNARSVCQEEASTSAEKNNDCSKSDDLSHEENVDPNGEDADSILSEPGNAIEEQGLDNEEDDEEEERQNTLGVGSSVSARDEPEMDPDLIEDDNDDRSSSSSSEEATADVANAVKNESFRNSVKKVLSVIQKSRGVPPLYPPPGSEPEDTSPRFSRPTKMEERSLYTRPTHHLSYSIASDMQVEVSEASSPPPMLNDPIGGESLDFDVDEDDSDEDLLGASTDPDRSEGSTPTSSREQPECSKQNLNNSQDTNSDSNKSEEQTIYSPRESIGGEFKEMNKPGDFPEHETSGVQQVARDSDAFHTERLQENVLMVGSASTNTEQNIDTYIHLPSNDLLSEDQENVYQDGGDYVPQQSLQTSVSQPVELELVAEPEVIDLIPSPRCVLQETVSMDDEASVNTEHKLIADIHPPMNAIGASSFSGPVTGSSSSPKSVLPEATPVREIESSCEPDINEYHRDEVENSSMIDAPQEDHQPDTLDEDSGSTRHSVNTASTRIPVASPLSATTAPPQTAPLDEMELRSSDSVQGASTSQMNDAIGEKADEKRRQDADHDQTRN